MMGDAALIKELLALMKLAIDMRRLQRIYYRTPADNPYRKDALLDAREAERLFDRAAAAFKVPSLL